LKKLLPITAGRVTGQRFRPGSISALDCVDDCVVWCKQTSHQLAMTEVDLERGDARLEAAEK